MSKKTENTMLAGVSVVPSSGGMPKTMRKFAEVLKARIYSFSSEKYDSSEIDAYSDVRHIRTHPNRLLDWYAWAPQKRRAEAEAFASQAQLLSCHVMLRYHANWVKRLAKENDIPYWFVPHGQLDPWVYTYRAGVKHLWLRVFGKRFMRDAAHVIFSTEQEREKAKWFYEGTNTRVIHWPVDLIDVSEKAQARAALREELGLKDRDRLLLYLGRIHSMKNPLKTIELLAKAGDERAHLLIVGPDGDISAEACRDAARKHGVDTQVHVPGPLYGEHKTRVLLGSDAFISLSYRENFGHTAAESIAAATPVILTPGNDLGPDIMPFECGFFLKDDSMESAVAGLKEFMAKSSPELKAMGERGRDFVAEKLSFEMFEEKLKALADEAIAGRSAGGAIE